MFDISHQSFQQNSTVNSVNIWDFFSKLLQEGRGEVTNGARGGQSMRSGVSGGASMRER